MCATFALSGIKRHARTPCSDALPYSWSAGQQHGISVSRPQLEAWHAAHHGLIGGKQKIMSIIIVSHAALLSVLAVHQLVDVIKILFHN